MAEREMIERRIPVKTQLRSEEKTAQEVIKGEIVLVGHASKVPEVEADGLVDLAELRAKCVGFKPDPSDVVRAFEGPNQIGGSRAKTKDVKVSYVTPRPFQHYADPAEEKSRKILGDT